MPCWLLTITLPTLASYRTSFGYQSVGIRPWYCTGVCGPLYPNSAIALSRPTLTSRWFGSGNATEFGDAPMVEPGSGSTLNVCVTFWDAASMIDTVSLLVLVTNRSPSCRVIEVGWRPTLIVPVTALVPRLTTEIVPVVEAPVTGLDTIG